MKKNRFLIILSIIFSFVIINSAFLFTGCVDYSKVINEITIDLMDSNIKIETRRTGMHPLGPTTDVLSGSGVIIAKDTDGYYYALTNHHVIDRNNSQFVEYHVTDYKGNDISTIGTALVLYSKELDLAVLKFFSQEEYDPIKISLKKQNVDTPVFSVGSPNEQMNAVTTGRIVSVIDAPTIGEEKPLTSSDGERLKVYSHSAYISGGSSGGMLINKNLQLIGINYAGITNINDGSFVQAFAIPMSETVEFLSALEIYDLIDFVK